MSWLSSSPSIHHRLRVMYVYSRPALHFHSMNIPIRIYILERSVTRVRSSNRESPTACLQSAIYRRLLSVSKEKKRKRDALFSSSSSRNPTAPWSSRPQHPWHPVSQSPPSDRLPHPRPGILKAPLTTHPPPTKPHAAKSSAAPNPKRLPSPTRTDSSAVVIAPRVHAMWNPGPMTSARSASQRRRLAIPSKVANCEPTPLRWSCSTSQGSIPFFIQVRTLLLSFGVN
jgi:hypothetical protein